MVFVQYSYSTAAQLDYAALDVDSLGGRGISSD